MTTDPDSDEARLARHRDACRTVHPDVVAAARARADEREAKLRRALDHLQVALAEADRIARADPEETYEIRTIMRRHEASIPPRRPQTLKDARRHARAIASELRAAWALLDPIA